MVMLFHFNSLNSELDSQPRMCPGTVGVPFQVDFFVSHMATRAPSSLVVTWPSEGMYMAVTQYLTFHPVLKARLHSSILQTRN